LANPQLEDGWTWIANEILEALAGINLSPYEGRALFFLIRKTYGWKKKTDWISLSQFSKGLGLDRRLVFRALKKLEGKRLVVICRDDKKRPTYGFQKNYEKWQMSDCHKTKTKDLNLERKVKREEREKKEEKASVEMTTVSSVEIPTKETITKETIKEERKEREERAAKTPIESNHTSLSKDQDQEQCKNQNQNTKAPLKDKNLQGVSLCLSSFERFKGKLSNAGYPFTENKMKMIFDSVVQRALKNNEINDEHIEELLVQFANEFYG